MYYRKCSLLTAIPRLPHIATICRSAAFIGFNYLGSCNLYMSNGRRQQRSAFICHFLGANWLILGDGCSNIFLSFSSSAILLATVLTTTRLASIVLNSPGTHTKLYSDFQVMFSKVSGKTCSQECRLKKHIMMDGLCSKI